MHIAADDLDKIQDSLMRAQRALAPVAVTTLEVLEARADALAAVLVAQSYITNAKDSRADPALIEAARDLYAMRSGDDVEIDDDAGTSGSDAGTWVQAWVYVRHDEEDEEDDSCGQCEGTGTIKGGLGGDGPDEECPVCDGSGILDEGAGLRLVPASHPVQPVEFMSAEYHNARARDALAQCGTCHRMWDDGEPTSYTPAPGGRCPFEAFHPDAD